LGEQAKLANAQPWMAGLVFDG